MNLAAFLDTLLFLHLTPRDARILLHIRTAVLPMARIADDVRINRGNLTKLVDALVTRGLVQRDLLSPGIRGALPVKLTPAGQLMLLDLERAGEESRLAAAAA